MKRLFTSLCLLAGLQVSVAQLTQANHAPAAGDSYDNWQCDSLGISIGASGAGVMWNYASIATRSSIVNSYVAVTATNTSFAPADVMVSSSPANTAYYKSSSTKLDYYGGNVMVGTVAAILSYSAPLRAANYPMSLNTTSTVVTGGTINVTAPLPTSGTFTGSSMFFADATGTLVLPSGTYTDVIRVITTQTVDFITTLASGTLTQANFDYYGGGIKSPLFTISTATAVTPLGTFNQTVVTRYKSPGPVSVSEDKEEASDIVVYPNPATNLVQFELVKGSAKSVTLFDITGKMAVTKAIENGNCQIDLSNFYPGIYLYSVSGAQGETLRTGKLVKY